MLLLHLSRQVIGHRVNVECNTHSYSHSILLAMHDLHKQYKLIACISADSFCMMRISVCVNLKTMQQAPYYQDLTATAADWKHEQIQT